MRNISAADTAAAPTVRVRKMGAPVVSTGVLRKEKNLRELYTGGGRHDRRDLVLLLALHHAR